MIQNCNSVYEYYTLLRFFAPGYEKRSLEEFTQSVNPRVVNESVTVPLLYLHSDDDMFFTKQTVEKYKDEMSQENPNVCFMQVKRGGHICFYEGFSAVAWTDRLAVELFQRIVELDR